jgi:hypothetical protein
MNGRSSSRRGRSCRRPDRQSKLDVNSSPSLRLVNLRKSRPAAFFCIASPQTDNGTGSARTAFVVWPRMNQTV